jgi:hypothetical protein
MTGNERSAAAILASCTLANAVLTPACVALAGNAGAAAALTLTLCAWQVAMAGFVQRRLGLLPGVLGRLCPEILGRAAPALPSSTS